ncbi:uncharacterized protein LOC106672775 isoform X2 [Cimex lectularius]|nr:uncharacterized protein LOC106672775 isoform X2 [Cimex lectularius]XP_014259943.1 uncharacterized protein LOC106672775 isoform X2 [Cimex lectularius]
MNLFRFWHFGKWISVLVDDRLPYDMEKQQFLFTSTGLPYEYWKPLLEKAYAKLMGSYWALEQTNILEFLEDLTGGITEYFNVKETTQILMKSVLKLGVAKGSIIICCTSIGQNERGDGADLRGSNYFMISTLKEVKYKETEYMLLRVKKLFGPFEEDGNFFKHTTYPQLVKSKKMAKEIKEESVEGEFWLTFKDFIIHLDHMFICNLCHDISLHHQHWELASYQGYWYENMSAGGPSKDFACFLTNPQFRILIRGKEYENLMPVIISLSQRRVPVLNKKSHLVKYKPFLPIGFTVYKVSIDNVHHLSYKYLCMNNPIYHARYYERREICVRLMIPCGSYVIIPSTAKPNMEGEFLLRVMTHHKSFMDLPWEPKEDISETLGFPIGNNMKKCSLYIQLNPRYLVGQPIDITVKVYAQDELNCPISICIACNCITTTGRGHRTIKGKEDTVYLEKGKIYETSLSINFYEYARKRLHEYVFTVLCSVYEQGGNAIIYDTKDFCLDLPELYVGYSQTEELESKFPVESWFVNPVPCPIEYGLFLVESPQLRTSPAVVETGHIGPMSRAVAQFDILPGSPGKYTVTVRFISKVFNLRATVELCIYEPESPQEEEKTVEEEEIIIEESSSEDEIYYEMETEIIDETEQMPLGLMEEESEIEFEELLEEEMEFEIWKKEIITHEERHSQPVRISDVSEEIDHNDTHLPSPPRLVKSVSIMFI